MTKDKLREREKKAYRAWVKRAGLADSSSRLWVSQLITGKIAGFFPSIHSLTWWQDPL